MNLVEKYLEYLKDNPNGYWFKRKLYGWGWTPARTEGWLVLLAYVAGVVFFAMRAEQSLLLNDVSREALAPILILTILLIVICYKKGEKPKWQWGKRVD